MTAARACAVLLLFCAALLPAAAIELGLAEQMHQATRSPSPKRVIIIDKTNQPRNDVPQEIAANMNKKNAKTMWHRIMASNIGMLPLFCAPPSLPLVEPSRAHAPGSAAEAAPVSRRSARGLSLAPSTKTGI